MHFCSVDVRRSDAEFAIVSYQISHRCDTNSIRVIFLWPIIDDRIGEREEFLFAVRRFDFLMCHYEHCICSFLPRLIIALRHSAKVFSERRLPGFRRGGVVHHFFVARDGLARHRMHHRIRVMLQIDVCMWRGEGIHTFDVRLSIDCCMGSLWYTEHSG